MAYAKRFTKQKPFLPPSESSGKRHALYLAVEIALYTGSSLSKKAPYRLLPLKRRLAMLKQRSTPPGKPSYRCCAVACASLLAQQRLLFCVFAAAKQRAASAPPPACRRWQQ
ncbi:hypothetical protein NPIL_466911 [Nephila pilipes]|uniref:Uncharacterized protein n=1 Tax=Nephila pilipes TaxID=299642 RepID=A0A8X6JTP8_NEPPI|nr:hypothetical protein NPIL_466911 [Nephila pilipes]